MAGTVRKRTRTSLHWGVYDIEVDGDRIVDAKPWAGDPDPSPIGQSIPTAVHHESRDRGNRLVFGERGDVFNSHGTPEGHNGVDHYLRC